MPVDPHDAREALARLIDPQAFDGSTESKHGKGVASYRREDAGEAAGRILAAGWTPPAPASGAQQEAIEALYRDLKATRAPRSQAPVIRIGENDDDQMSKVDSRSMQDHRDEAYKTGWDDGYAEGFGKATVDAHPGSDTPRYPQRNPSRSQQAGDVREAAARLAEDGAICRRCGRVQVGYIPPDDCPLVAPEHPATCECGACWQAMEAGGPR